MTDHDSLVSELHEARRRFMALVEEVRPDLHRYCARMTGSIVDGEDIVQDTLARAYYGLSELGTMPQLRPWLFRIAHNRALDYLRRYDRRLVHPLEDSPDMANDDTPDPEDALAREEAVRAAVSRFVTLPPAQRSCVVLKDVLGDSLEEIAALVDLSVPAVKAALHRGRVGLRAQAESTGGDTVADRKTSPTVARYAELFNARDWDGVRAMLAEDVRLDLVTRAQRSGRREVGDYFTNYDKIDDWWLVPAWLDGREVLAVFRDRSDARPGYVIELSVVKGQIAKIHDLRYVPYVLNDAIIELSGESARFMAGLAPGPSAEGSRVSPCPKLEGARPPAGNPLNGRQNR